MFTALALSESEKQVPKFSQRSHSITLRWRTHARCMPLALVVVCCPLPPLPLQCSGPHMAPCAEPAASPVLIGGRAQVACILHKLHLQEHVPVCMPGRP